MYRTKGEPSLKYSMMVAMDGNNLLKLVDSLFRAGKPRANSQQSLSPQWISPSDVDRFMNDTGTSQSARRANDEDWLDFISQSPESPPPSDLPICVERWKNAAPDARKKMFEQFSVSGIFLAVCWHGHALAICDMICSGELYADILMFSTCDLRNLYLG